MNLSEMRELIDKKKKGNKNCESKEIEWKSTTSKLTQVAETLCAFLNSKGGTVFVGITNDGKIVGQEVSDKTKIDIGKILVKFEPTANIEIEYIDVENGRQVIVFTAHQDLRCIPYVFDGKPWERLESETQLMKQARYQQLLLNRNVASHAWEDFPARDITMDDLDVDEIYLAAQDINREKRSKSIVKETNANKILARLGLIENNNILNAAAVLFAKGEPRGYMQCVFRMARFKGIEKSNKNIIDIKHVYGNAFQLLKEAEIFISRNTAMKGVLKSGEFARDDQPEYPVDGVRESLINSICHRAYNSPGGSVSLFIYDDRLEIASFGLLPQGISLNELKGYHTSHPRNPKILSMFFMRGFIEALGYGTQEIVKSCLDVNMKEPEFFEQAGCFVMRMWSRHYNHKVNVDGLLDRHKSILDILQAGFLSSKEILELLEEKVADRTLRKDLLELREKGFISSSGKGKRTVWSLVESSKIRQ